VPPQDLTDRRRDEIAKAARATFARKGYQATGIADIAGELGIGHGTFYRYFENKRDILEYVIGLTVERVTEVLAAEDPQSTNTLEEYRAQAERIGQALFDLFVSDPELARLFFVEGFSADPELTERMFRAQEQLAALGERYLVNGVEKGFLAPDLDTPATAQAVNGMIFAGALAVVRMPDPAAARSRWVAAVSHLMFEGVGR
jgi:AcrR family transcriptional regulator